MPEGLRSTPAQRLAAATGRQQTASADTIRSEPDPVAISPALGPLPAIYVPPRGQPGLPGPLWRAAATVVRPAFRWIARQHRRNHARHPR
jgi:hypothetical protein